jgi:gamma-glutamyltranspeptidase / glutathione hydrolase
MRFPATARSALVSGLVVALAVSLASAPSTSAASRRPLVAGKGMVVAPEREAAAVGVSVLRGGGNAVDAAVAVAFALAVTYPRAGNLGGGGFLLYRAPDGSHVALDFRETAPSALTAAMFTDATGRIDAKKSLNGGLSVGVPGTVAGLLTAHERWGSRPLSELVKPAIRLAKLGVVVSERSAEVLAAEKGRLAADPAAATLFTRNGAPLPPGDLLVQKDLANTLEAISERGVRGFYEGPVAGAIVKATVAAGGVMTLEDLARYRAIERPPLVGSYRGKTIVTFPPPSSGGIVLLQALALLEPFDLAASGAGASLTLHRIAEAERRAFADRTVYLGDPDVVEVPVKQLLDPAYLASRGATIRDDQATPSSTIRPGTLPAHEGMNTLHFSVADDRGGAVALTTTLNSWYGAALVAPGTGVLLNNEIDDFALGTGIANQYGLVGGSANAVAGGKRPLSSMCPTIVENTPQGRRPFLVLGSPGGPTIISSVLQTIVHVVDDRMSLQEAVDAPRIHHQWLPDEIFYERGALAADVTAGLTRRGHKLTAREPIGNVCAIGLDAQGRYTGALDPRDEAVAEGY